ncbi:hypothetical protein DAEQUDRAFT_765902 [Daedalea quercina L-15889]|uniref:HTH La-type RNA-binding domain-containing protein n=1 Tax=Daedalea quercina L-15889 TaxID=1314783 RepID=A0A165Q1N4_9APHY|nr:hypothetical protein DAEQUDRAFT_765902 [Daedalea quercina L-15889]
MVSSQPQSISRTLSYADRAKGFQSVKPKNASTTQRLPQPSGSGTGASGIAADTNMTTSKPTPSPHAETLMPSASQPSSSPPPLPAPATTTTNGDVKLSSADSPSSVPPNDTTSSSNAAHKSVPPPVNVWNRRMEQMAQTRAKSGQPSSHQPLRPPPSPQDHTVNLQNDGHDVASSSPTLQNATNPAQISSTTVANGSSDNRRSDEDDAFVVRLRVRSPPVSDIESWPEVGKAMSSGSGPSDPEYGANVQEKGDREGDPASGQTRKSEKTKWVPIPAVELQAAADAQQRAQHMRNRSSQHLNAHQRHSNQGSASASASGSGSQGQSRTQSVAGGTRQSASGSHAGSVSQSQTQSRTGSTQSSPPGAFKRGGRRLPEEGMTYPAGASRSISMRSSRTGSPQTYQPTLPPPSDAVANAMGYRGLPLSLGRGGSGQGGEQDQPGMPPYYVPMPPRSYHSPHPSDSPVHPPYALPPIAPVPTLYSTPSMQPPPPPAPFAGTPPYPMYPQYGYPYPPYMYWQPSTSPVVPEGVPPPMMLGRPPLPGENEGATTYRDPGFVLPPPASYERPVDQQPQATQAGGAEGNAAPIERGRRLRELSFGTIDADPASDPDGEDSGALGLRVTSEEPQEEDGAAKPTPPFAIGVAPGEPGPARIRSRTHSKGRTLVLGGTVPAVSRTVSEQSDQPGGEAGSGARNAVEEIEAAVKVIDLTEPGETKWEFGTTKQVDAEVIAEVGPSMPRVNGPEQPVPPPPGPALGVTGMDPVSPPFVHQSTYVAPPPLPPIMTTTNGLGSAHSPSYSGPSALPPLSTSDASQSDDLRVKDYGYGFGRKNYAPFSAHGERRDWQAERPPEREYYGRSRRGSFGGGYGYDRGGYERGGFGGRRARGGGRGYEGRGGYHARSHSRGGGAYHGSQSRQPPFTVQPPPLQTDVNGYYAPPPQGTTYYTPPYDPYLTGYPAPAYPPLNLPSGAPLPKPISEPSFPLDSVRYYLLGQLEYYLSPQNLARDLYLKQQMDSRGWISIPLLASFKRVQQLTTDLQLVKDVLTLSTVVEVRDEHVRMLQWAQFVLPNASESTVESMEELEWSTSSHVLHDSTLAHDESLTTEHGDEGEEEEEEVVFVLERPAPEA